MGVLRVRDPATRSWIDITSSADEVEISTADPALLNAGCELWYDVNTTPGVLKARVNGAWEAVEVSEVHVGPDDPYDLNPDAQDQLFYDTTIQTLMVRVNDTWQPVTILDPNEVFVGASTPTPDVEIWYDTASADALPVDGILKVRDTRTGLWHVATPEEVWVDDQDPLSRGNTEAELWFDLSLTPPVLKANVSGAWVPVSPDSEPPLDEVWVGQERPDPVGTYELWVDTSTEPPILMGKNEAGVWVPLTFPAPLAPPDEVLVSPAQPQDVTTELWVDSTLPDPVLRANIAGAWIEVSPSEVEVSTSDPYLNPAGSRAELWHDRSTGQNGILKVRIGNDWRPVAELAQSETEISATDPISYNPQAELWVDTSSSPVTLWGRVNNGWVKITGPVADAPEEVNIGPVDPRDSMVELWYDTTNTPGTLKANNFGTWEPIGESEVTVDNIDPYITSPDATAELWFNPSMGMLSARFNDQWLEVTPDPPNEVSIQGSAPSNPDVELWHDISTDPPVLKAKVQQVWKPVIPASADEVYVGPEDPDVVEPESERDLWYDTDAWGRGSGGFPGGNANEALVKVSEFDSDVRWGGDLTVPNNLLVNGDATMSLDAKLTAGSVRVEADGQGLFLNGNGGLIKKVGGGIVLRKHSGNTHPVVENNDGTNATNIITANGAAQMTGVLQWPNATGAKIHLYSTTFGIGVESGTTTIWASGTVSFHQNASNGARWAFIDGSCGNGRVITEVNGDARYSKPGHTHTDYVKLSAANAGYIVLSGSNSNNTRHYYVDSESNDEWHFKVLEARKLNAGVVWYLNGYQTSSDCMAKMYTNLGTEGIKEINQWCDYGDGQACLHVHGPCKASHFHDYNRSAAVAETITPMNPELVGRLIDAVRPIAFARHFRSLTATDANEPGFVPPEHDPIPTLGFDFDGVNGECVDLTDRIIGSSTDGYSIGGMLAVAISEIQSLRTRVAQLEGAA